MDETLLKLRVLTRAEVTLAKANARRIAARSRLYVIALGMVLITVVMFNFAAFEYISTQMSNAMAALTIAIVNGLLAMLLLYMATRIRPGPEEEMVREIRELEINFNHETLLGDQISIAGNEGASGENYFLATREGDGQEIISARLKRE